MKKAVLCVSKNGHAYGAALVSVGIDPIMVSVESNPTAFPEVLGLVLTGGKDIDPAFYGQVPGADIGEISPDRDKLERWLTQQALQRDLPILAICRGMQMLNVVLGGSLIQHLNTAERHNVRLKDKSQAVHQVRIEPDSALARALGETLIQVNSRHHQGLAAVGKNVRVTGRCPDDGVIEAIEIEGRRFVWGVQWHPENMIGSSKQAERLFTAFAQAL